MGRYLEFIKTYRLLHRNSQKHIIFPDACYFVTCKTQGNVPFFRERIFCDLFVENLRFCKRFKGFLLFGWVLAYDHFHLLVQPGDEWNVSEIMHCLKRNFSHNANIINGIINPSEGRDNYPGLRFRGMLDKYQQQFIQKHKNQNPYPKFKWQDKFHDHYIRNENDFDYHMEYIEHNQIKHGLPSDWPYIYTNPEYLHQPRISRFD